MQINIRVLLNELIDSVDKDAWRAKGVSSRWYLQLMKWELDRLDALNQVNVQHKRIALLMGGLIYALNQEDDEECKYPVRLYPAETVSHTRRELSWFKLNGISELEYMAAIGEEALSNLPEAFNADIFKTEAQLTDNGPAEVVFQGLKAMADKVEVLVKFCIAHSDNLNTPTIDTDYFATEECKKAEEKYQMLAEFRQKHKASFHGGWFGSFFSRTNLPAYNDAKTILEHAQKSTFFGFRNRTFQTLREMSVINEQGEVIKPGFN